MPAGLHRPRRVDRIRQVNALRPRQKTFECHLASRQADGFEKMAAGGQFCSGEVVAVDAPRFV